MEAYYRWLWDPPVFEELPYDPFGDEGVAEEFGSFKEDDFSFSYAW